MFGILPGESVYAHVTDVGDNSTTVGYALEATFRTVTCGDGVSARASSATTATRRAATAAARCASSRSSPTTRPSRTTRSPRPPGTWSRITGDTNIQGTIQPILEVDTYRVTVTTPTVVRFETLTSLYECGGGTTLDLRLFDMAGTPIIADTVGLGINLCSALVFFLDAGTYFIRVEERGNDAATPAYALQVDYQTGRGAESELAGRTRCQRHHRHRRPQPAGGGDVYVFGDHQDSADVDVYAITGAGRARASARRSSRAIAPWRPARPRGVSTAG